VTEGNCQRRWRRETQRRWRSRKKDTINETAAPVQGRSALPTGSPRVWLPAATGLCADGRRGR
jgi:hypothetical protein